MRLLKTRFKCKCGGSLKKVPYHNKYYCDRCGKSFTLPHDKARKENMRTYLDTGRIFNKAVIRNGEVWYK